MLPVFRAMKTAAEEVRDVSKVVKEQVPDTMSAVRLSGLDLSELSSEVGSVLLEYTYVKACSF